MDLHAADKTALQTLLSDHDSSGPLGLLREARERSAATDHRTAQR